MQLTTFAQPSFLLKAPTEAMTFVGLMSKQRNLLWASRVTSWSETETPPQLKLSKTRSVQKNNHYLCSQDKT